MPQIFHRRANTIARLCVLVPVLAVTALLSLAAPMHRSAWSTEAFVARAQPVEFSHARHICAARIDCRYCHTSVEDSRFAGIPPVKTCMNCHAEIGTDSPLLQPVRDAFENDRSIEWTRVHDLPDFVHFDHSIHVSKGVGCTTCHGPVDQMAVVSQQVSLQMEWCLECHRNPERYVRPRNAVFSVGYQPPFDQAQLGARLVAEYEIQKLTSCSTCHQ